MTLAEGRIGKEYRITNVTKGAGFQRLFEFGFTVGASVFIREKAPFHGAMLICVRHSYVMIDIDTAKMIAVEEVRDEA